MHSPGQDPCPILEKHGGIWKFDENKLNQKEDDGVKYVDGTASRTGDCSGGRDALYITMNSRDQLDTLWPGQFTAQENAERPAEPMYRAEMGLNFGWPFCFYDYGLKKLVTNPEYGGDGKSSDRCTIFESAPVASLPGALGACRYDVLFRQAVPQAISGRRVHRISRLVESRAAAAGRLQRDISTFREREAFGRFRNLRAGGFAGKAAVMNPNIAMARPDGVAEAPDGSLYIADSQKGRLWRVFYRGK